MFVKIIQERSYIYLNYEIQVNSNKNVDNRLSTLFIEFDFTFRNN